jgi:hypothetical protein
MEGNSDERRAEQGVPRDAAIGCYGMRQYATRRNRFAVFI